MYIMNKTDTRNGKQGSRMGTRIEKGKGGDDGVDVGDFEYTTSTSSKLRSSYTKLHTNTPTSSFRKLPSLIDIALSITRLHV